MLCFDFGAYEKSVRGRSRNKADLVDPMIGFILTRELFLNGTSHKKSNVSTMEVNHRAF